METIANIHHAKTHLSALLSRVAKGEEIILAKAGTPIAKLVPYRKSSSMRKPGGWEGKVYMSPDFDDLPKSLRSAFRGEKP